MSDSLDHIKHSEFYAFYFRQVFAQLITHGIEVSPRGQKTIEVENFQYTFPPFVRFCNFTSRNLKMSYIKKEFLWYLKGDKHDLSIADSAKLWNSFIDEGGIIHSNYGQYIFGELNQFDYVIRALSQDKDSRRASITILQPYHVLKEKIVDVPCTYGLAFRIRNNKLNMTVKMRSNDAYFGFGSDVPIFSFIHEMMLNALREFYPDLEYGDYCHFVESFHIYEQHFPFLKTVQEDEYIVEQCPRISGPEEVKFIRRNDFTNIPDEYQFAKWLVSDEKKT